VPVSPTIDFPIICALPQLTSYKSSHHLHTVDYAVLKITAKANDSGTLPMPTIYLWKMLTYRYIEYSIAPVQDVKHPFTWGIDRNHGLTETDLDEFSL